ncbi:hypothetical protein BB559_000496 [Furculomyces boomerangus]|uniref:Uncharacterized protein n=1 Tax=Furculomyces boomerangus TaxID=61424 RepID=A0A2T9Z527_9FUNG|nr:hypothetical protein BB559_000496 [Furculomyces boomerangus]
MDTDKTRKFVVLGYRGVGKTSLILRYTENTFIENYYPTIEDAHWKTVKFNGITYRFNIIDTAGQDEFSILNSQYAIGIDMYVIVFSVASRLSFDMVHAIYNKILDQSGVDQIRMVLVGSKSDLVNQRQVTQEMALETAKELNCKYIECSAKAEVNIVTKTNPNVSKSLY